MAYAAGVDVGSTQTKAVVIDEHGRIAGRSLTMTGANVTQAAETAFAEALKDGDLREEEVEYVVGTGYGRYKVTFGNTQVTEISCHGRGAVHMFPATRTVVDMGGQDTKAIRVSPRGEIVDFCMNDKCAAGPAGSGTASAALRIPLPRWVHRAARPPVDQHHLHRVRRVRVLSWLGKGKKRTFCGASTSRSRRSVGLMRRVGIERR